MKAKQLTKRHEDFEEMLERWEFLNLAYKGGDAYRKAGYLERHPREQKKKYLRRLKQAIYVNYSAPVIDIYISYLFKETIAREFGVLAGNKNLDDFMEDCDFNGTDFSAWMRETARMASITGLVGMVLDKPATSFTTKAEEVAAGVRPYLVRYSPEHIINFEFVRKNGRPVLSKLVLHEEMVEDTYGAEIAGLELYRVWTREDWKLYGVEDKKNNGNTDAKLIDQGVNTLGEIPFVMLANRKTSSLFIGNSDINDIADINRRIFYIDSDAHEIIENTAFPMLQGPREQTVGSNEAEIEVGSGNVLEFDPRNPAAKWEWMEPPHSSLREIREWRHALVDDIRALARTGGTDAQSTKVQSGVSLEITFQQLNSILAEKGEGCENAETGIFRFFAAWEEQVFDGEIDYPRKFGVRDVSNEIDNATKAKLLVNSKTFDAEVRKRVAKRVLGDTDPEVMKAINDEVKVPNMADVVNA